MMIIVKPVNPFSLGTEAILVKEKMLANIFRGLLLTSRSIVHIVIDDRILSISLTII